jgi:hypothetical protein
MTEDTETPTFAEPHVASAIIQVITMAPVPEPAVDGDCLYMAPLITEALHKRDVDVAETVWVVAKDANGAIVYLHKATRVDNLIIDCAAQQFSPNLPPRWLAEEDKYIEAMVRETSGPGGCVAVTITTGNPLA